MHGGVATSRVVGKDPGDNWAESQPAGSLWLPLAYHVGVCYLLGFYGSACLSVGSFACLLAPLFFLNLG